MGEQPTPPSPAPACTHTGGAPCPEVRWRGEPDDLPAGSLEPPQLPSDWLSRQHRPRASPGLKARGKTGVMSEARAWPSEADWVPQAHQRSLHERCVSLESDNTKVQFPGEPLSCCVILSKLLSVSESQFLHLEKMGKGIPTSLSCCED